jgi:hypothetical protein
VPLLLPLALDPRSLVLGIPGSIPAQTGVVCALSGLVGLPFSASTRLMQFKPLPRALVCYRPGTPSQQGSPLSLKVAFIIVACYYSTTTPVVLGEGAWRCMPALSIPSPHSISPFSGSLLLRAVSSCLYTYLIVPYFPCRGLQTCWLAPSPTQSLPADCPSRLPHHLATRPSFSLNFAWIPT